MGDKEALGAIDADVVIEEYKKMKGFLQENTRQFAPVRAVMLQGHFRDH